MTTPGSGRSSIGVRVRPNADNFIRDLKAQLAAKKATYWVDVKANMTPANKDVLAWSKGELKGFSPEVPVGANTTPATRDLNKWKNAQREIKTNIPIGVDMTPAQRELTAWRQAAKRELEIPVKLNVRDLDAALERAARRRVRTEVEVDADTTPVERKLSGLFLPGGQFKEIKIDADTKPAERKLEELNAKAKADPPKSQLELDVDEAQNKLRTLRIAEAAKKLGVTVDIDADPKKAELQLKLLRAKAAVRDLELNVRVKRRGIDDFLNSLRSIEKRVGQLTVLRSLDLGPITLGKPTGLVGTLATLTTLAGLIPAIVTGISALSNGFMQLAGAASIVPGAIGGIIASLSTFAIASSGVGDAIGAMFDMWNEGASAQASTSKQVMSAQNGYRNALVDETRAQKDLSQARQDALNDLRNLNNELRGGVLNEAQAILDAQKARDRYAQGLAKGFDSETDRLQGLLDIAKADQNIRNIRESNLQLQQKATKADAQGVEGSDRVTQALEAQARAQQAVAESLEGLGAAGKSSAMTKFNELLENLSPNAREFMETLMGMRGPLMDFRNTLQDTLFQGLGPALENVFTDLLPIIQPGMQSIAQAMNHNLLQVFDTLQSPDGQSIIERILGGTAQAQEALTGLIDPLVRGFGTLMAAGAEHLPQFVELMTQLADRFANFIEEADKSGALDKFMDSGIQALQNLSETAIDLLGIIHDFSTAFQSAFGTDVLTMISNLVSEWHDWTSSAEGQKKINEYIAEARDLWNEWKPVLEKLPEVFDAVAQGAANVLEVVMPFLEKFANFAKEHPNLVAGFVTAWLGAKVLTGVLSPVLGVLSGLLNQAMKIPGVAKALRNIPGMPGGTPGAPSAGGGGLGTAARLAPVAAAIAPAVVAPALVQIGADRANQQPGQADIDQINSSLPPNVKPVTGFHADKVTRESLAMLAEQGDPAAKWIMAAIGPQAIKAPGSLGGDWIMADPESEKEVARRYAWAMTHPDQTGANFVPPPVGSYALGGYTNWPKSQGGLAMLHGREYIHPADTTAFYGRAAMEAIHDKRVPREVLAQFTGPLRGHAGRKGAYDTGGHYDPNTGQWVPDTGPTVTNAMAPNPAGGPGIISTVSSGIAAGVSHGVSVGAQVAQGVAQGVGTGPAPGPAPSVSAGVGVGPAPGPVDAAGNPTFGVDTSGGTYTGKGAEGPSINLFGFKIPLGGPTNMTPNRGWGEGGPPIGLGGGEPGPNGEAPFDIRRFGIGPGPVGSGPTDWAQFTADTLGTFGSGLLTSFTEGVFGFFGLQGLLSNVQSAGPLISHFGNPDQEGVGGSSGNAQTNADVAALLDTASNMPVNPDYPGVPDLPAVFDPSTGSALSGGGGGGGASGLQVNTARGKAVIQRYFPWATNIGGVRKDSLKWHPSGLALDVMTDPGHGNNDPPSPQGLARGNQLYAWLKQNQEKLGIDYILWQEKDHYNHLHVNFAPSGYGPGGGPPPDVSVTAPQPAPKPGGWFPGAPKGPTTPSQKRQGPTTPSQKRQGYPGFDVGGMFLPPMANPNYGWNPDQFRPGGTQEGKWYVPSSQPPGWKGGPNPPQIIPPSQGPSTGGWQVGPGSGFVPPWARHRLFDRGGWLMPGTTVTHNYTGKPELVIPHDALRSFAPGGFAGGVPLSLPVIPKPPVPPPPIPRPPDARTITPPPAQARPAIPAPPPAAVAPRPAPPSMTPGAPPAAPTPAGPPPPPGGVPLPTPAAPGGRESNAIAFGPAPVNPPQIEEQSHVHPALSKGIRSGAATLGNIASTAISIASSLAAGAGTMGAASGAAGAAGGGLGSFVAGLIQQGGKIVENIANVGSSFLVGNITGGTTSNAYGVTQRGSNPSGGTRVIDASNNQYGDIYTNNLDEYFARMRRKEDQQAQVRLARWSR